MAWKAVLEAWLTPHGAVPVLARRQSTRACPPPLARGDARGSARCCALPSPAGLMTQSGSGQPIWADGAVALAEAAADSEAVFVRLLHVRTAVPRAAGTEVLARDAQKSRS
jgi:hypothetical protein